MFQSLVKKASNYLKNHPRYTLMHVLGLLLGCVYLFQLNTYVLEATSFEVLGKEIGFIHVESHSKNNTYRELSMLAEKLGDDSEMLMDVIEKEFLPMLAGNKQSTEKQKDQAAD